MHQNSYESGIVGNLATTDPTVSETATNSPGVATWIILLTGTAVGLIVAILWLPAIADDTIGMNLAMVLSPLC